MDMNSTSSSMNDTSSSMDMDMMTPYLHFSGGDNLLFMAWAPSSPGAIVGACIGLIAVAILERFVGAVRTVMDAHLRERALRTRAPSAVTVTENCGEAGKSSDPAVDKLSYNGSSSAENACASKPLTATRTIPPFIWSYEMARGATYAFQALLGYVLMLSVMTFQAAYLIAIVGGLGIGEMLFGRMGNNVHNPVH